MHNMKIYNIYDIYFHIVHYICYLFSYCTLYIYIMHNMKIYNIDVYMYIYMTLFVVTYRAIILHEPMGPVY